MSDNSEFILGAETSTPRKGRECLKICFPSEIESPIQPNEDYNVGTVRDLSVTETALLPSERYLHGE